MWNNKDLKNIENTIMSVDDDNSNEEGEVITSTKNRVKKPNLYKVLLHNDDYTTMEFVIEILQRVFGKGLPEANQIMIKVHEQGRGVCGIYSFEIAETKANKVMKLAKSAGHPLKSSIEME